MCFCPPCTCTQATPAQRGGGEQSVHVALARRVDFQTFVFTATLRSLQAAAASEVGGAVACGTAGSADDAAAAAELFAVPAWLGLAAPLFSAAQTTLLACAKARLVPEPGSKREKDPTEPLTMAAVRALEQLYAMAAASPGGVASALRAVPPPAADVVAEAGLPALPPAAAGGSGGDGEEGSPGLTPAQRVTAAALPHFRQLLAELAERCCHREVEALCPALGTLGGGMPPAYADAIAGWAVAACEEAQPAVREEGWRGQWGGCVFQWMGRERRFCSEPPAATATRMPWPCFVPARPYLPDPASCLTLPALPAPPALTCTCSWRTRGPPRRCWGWRCGSRRLLGAGTWSCCSAWPPRRGRSTTTVSGQGTGGGPCHEHLRRH